MVIIMTIQGNFNAIRVNHRGFLKNGAKRFVLTENKTGALDFQVRLYQCDIEHPVLFEGAMIPETDTDGSTVWTGDFSAMCAEGDFYITAGGFTSRQFVVYDGAYDICKRMMLEYYTYQRCGSDLGWNGKCHTDDGYIAETGEHVDLVGGYHQSCDLRKSPSGVSIGVLSMMRAAMADNSAWGRHLFPDEAAWACDYYVKTIQQNGAMYNTLNAPLGWEGRIFYKSPAPSSAQWCVTTILALGARYFAERDSERSKRYLETALRSWKFMTGDERPTEQYRHPDKHPRGMDADNFYELCRKGGSADLGYFIVAAAELYRATADNSFLDIIRETVGQLMTYQLDGALACTLRRDDHPDMLVYPSSAYCWAHSGINAFLDAYELLGDICGLGDAIHRAADALCEVSARSPYRLLRRILSETDLDVVMGHPAPGRVLLPRRAKMKNLMRVGSFSADGQEVDAYINEVNKVDQGAGWYAIFLARASRLLGEARWMATAQAHLDALLGTNAIDSSAVRGVGYNNPYFKAFGQFFPSTPCIPGAMGVSYASLTDISEFDMPLVGVAMELITALSG